MKKKVKVKLNFEEVNMMRELAENYLYSKNCEDSERDLVISLIVKCEKANYKICK